MSSRVPISTLLSQVLVAFTIEFDNEAEHQLPHRTTRHGSTADSGHGPWLVSAVMWMNCMRFVDENGISVRELERLARTHTNLHGMQRWRYIIVEADPADKRPKPPRSAWLVRPTRAGRYAQKIWQPLFAVIEERWERRFGKAEIDALRKSLTALVEGLDLNLPDCLPILGYGLFSTDWINSKPEAGNQSSSSDLPLLSLLSKVLLAFAIEFENESEVSLAIGANILRIAGDDPVRVRDLPRLAGVSKESIAMAFTFLENRGYARIQTESSGSRTKVAVLTAKGLAARKKYFDLLQTIEARWQATFGKKMPALRSSLESLASDGTAPSSPLFQGLVPYPGNWRASLPLAAVLPHYPMVLHRGGYPDGS